MTESKPEHPYRYFDSPDGQDVFKKLWYVVKPAAATGVLAATTDVLCIRKQRTYIEVAGRMAYITFPIIGIAAAFVLGTNLTAQMRAKDDKLNWVVGAASAGGVFGVWRRSAAAGFAAVGIFTILGIIRKDCFEKGYSWIPEDRKVAYGGAYAASQDYTLTAERPRNWIAG